MEDTAELIGQDSTRPYEIVFDLQFDAMDRDFMQQHAGEVAAAYCAALKVLFQVPITTPARLRARHGAAYRLDNVEGVIGRAPSIDEVKGCLIGVTMAIKAAHLLRHTLTDMNAAHAKN